MVTSDGLKFIQTTITYPDEDPIVYQNDITIDGTGAQMRILRGNGRVELIGDTNNKIRVTGRLIEDLGFEENEDQSHLQRSCRRPEMARRILNPRTKTTRKPEATGQSNSETPLQEVEEAKTPPAEDTKKELHIIEARGW